MRVHWMDLFAALAVCVLAVCAWHWRGVWLAAWWRALPCF